MSSSIPSWQTLTAHVQLFRGARDLAFFLKVPLDSLLVWASSGGSGETARMRRLAWTFAARIGDKYQIRLAGPIWYLGQAIESDCIGSWSLPFYLLCISGLLCLCRVVVLTGLSVHSSNVLIIPTLRDYIKNFTIDFHSHSRTQGEGRFKPLTVIYYWSFQGCASVVVYSNCLCSSAFCWERAVILAFHFFFFFFFLFFLVPSDSCTCPFPIWCLGQDVEFDCIGPWPLPFLSILLLFRRSEAVTEKMRNLQALVEEHS